jgi:hypothetical protein
MKEITYKITNMQKRMYQHQQYQHQQALLVCIGQFWKGNPLLFIRILCLLFEAQNE